MRAFHQLAQIAIPISLFDSPSPVISLIFTLFIATVTITRLAIYSFIEPVVHVYVDLLSKLVNKSIFLFFSEGTLIALFYY